MKLFAWVRFSVQMVVVPPRQGVLSVWLLVVLLLLMHLPLPKQQRQPAVCQRLVMPPPQLVVYAHQRGAGGVLRRQALVALVALGCLLSAR